jgi:hypothetical protein
VGNGNDDISSEEHFENLKTSRGSYLELQLVIFVQKSDFYLMTSAPLKAPTGQIRSAREWTNE